MQTLFKKYGFVFTSRDRRCGGEIPAGALLLFGNEWNRVAHVGPWF